MSVALKNYSGSEGGQLLTVNPSGDRAYMEEFEGTFRCLTPGDGGMLLLTGAHLYRTDAVGLGDTAEVARDGRLVGTIGRKVLVLGLTALSEAVFP